MADSGDDKGWSELPQKSKVSPELIVAAIVAVVLVIFIVQNNEDTDVMWLVRETSTPLWVVIFVSAIAGYLLGSLVNLAIKRRRRRGHS